MKTSTLISIIVGAALASAMWVRLETIVATQGEKLTEVISDIRDIKSYLKPHYTIKGE